MLLAPAGPLASEARVPPTSCESGLAAPTSRQLPEGKCPRKKQNGDSREPDATRNSFGDANETQCSPWLEVCITLDTFRPTITFDKLPSESSETAKAERTHVLKCERQSHPETSGKHKKAERTQVLQCERQPHPETSFTTHPRKPAQAQNL